MKLMQWGSKAILTLHNKLWALCILIQELNVGTILASFLKTSSEFPVVLKKKKQKMPGITENERQ